MRRTAYGATTLEDMLLTFGVKPLQPVFVAIILFITLLK